MERGKRGRDEGQEKERELKQGRRLAKADRGD